MAERPLFGFLAASSGEGKPNPRTFPLCGCAPPLPSCLLSPLVLSSLSLSTRRLFCQRSTPLRLTGGGPASEEAPFAFGRAPPPKKAEEEDAFDPTFEKLEAEAWERDGLPAFPEFLDVRASDSANS